MVEKLQVSEKFSRDYLQIIGCAFVLSVLAVGLSSYINSLAFDVQPMIGDGAYQYGFSASSYLDYLYAGRLAAIWNAYIIYPRPIWSIFPLIVNPELLIEVNGHIVLGGIFLFCFLAVLGISIFKRTRLLSYALVCMMAVLAAGNFFHYRLGMGGNYTDVQTAWLIGAALFSLINSEEATRGHWLIGFGIFSAFAQQSRYVSIGVTAIVCGPILGYYLVNRWRQERTKRSVLIPLAQTLIPIILISGYSLIAHIGSYIYAVVLSPVVASGVIHLYKPVNEAIALYLRVYDYHLGKVGIAMLLLFCVDYFLLYWRERNKNGSVIVSLWAAIAFLITHIFLLRVADEWIYTVYLLPGFYLFAFLPFDLSPQKLTGIGLKLIVHKVLSICGIVALLTIGFNNFERISADVARVSESDRQLLTYQKDMAVILTRLAKQYYPDIQTWEDVPTFEAFVEIRDLTSAQPIYIETWYRHRQPIRWVNVSLVWKSMYEAAYPNSSREEIQKLVYQEMLEEIDFAIVLSDPRNEKAVLLSEMYPELESDEWNLKINEYIYGQLSKNRDDWAEEQMSEQLPYKSPYGDIHIFRNLNRYAKRSE